MKIKWFVLKITTILETCDIPYFSFRKQGVEHRIFVFWNLFRPNGTITLNFNRLNEFYVIFFTCKKQHLWNHRGIIEANKHFVAADTNILGAKTTQVFPNAMRSFCCFAACIPRGKCSGSWADPETWAYVPLTSANTLFWNLSWIAWASPHSELWCSGSDSSGRCHCEISSVLLAMCVVWMIPLKIFRDSLLPAYFPLAFISLSKKMWISFCFKSWEIRA